MTRFRLSQKTFPLALLWVTLLAYGPLVPWLTFYWDDWPYLWLYHVEGPAGFVDFVASDRPFSAWIFSLTTALFGEAPLPYHVLALLLRWLSVVAFWWMLRLIWTDQPRLVNWAALLFAVYPGFLEQPIALIYNHHLSVLCLFLYSMGAMLLAVRRPHWSGWLTASALIAAAGMFSIEYYVGLELLRPFLVWLVFREQTADRRAQLKGVLLRWFPYLLLWVGFLIWRVVIFKFPTYQPVGWEDFLAAPVSFLSRFIQTILQDLSLVTFVAWVKTLSIPEGIFSVVVYLVVVLLGAGSLMIYLRKLEDQATGDTVGWGDYQDRWAKEAILVGGFALLFAGWPAWLTNLPVGLEYPWDRLTLPFMFGVSLVVTGLIEWFIRPRLQRLIIVVCLVSLSMGWHFQNANSYRREEKMVREFFWQLSWRAPGLHPGTMILTQEMPVAYYSDNSLTAPLNWTYAPGQTSRELRYMLYDAQVRVGSRVPHLLATGLPVEQSYRSLRFSGTTSNILVVYYPYPGCVRVLDPKFDDGFPDLPFPLVAVLPISNRERIISDASSVAQPPGHLLGAEPVRGWCYYFQKAELARQGGDWEQIVVLWEEVSRLGLNPNETSERLPFMEAFARLRDWENARQLSSNIREVPYLQKMLCKTWERIQSGMQLSADETAAIVSIKEEAGCDQD